ncbi:MAG: type 1 glutamine amidotransferase domain-containing protein [Brevundimonas sp.]|nr:type 1 glutamine amidotransferase domain-containing protein [Brevundimonas sp.]
MTKAKVLVVGSNANRIEVQGGGFVPTGQYLNETVVPVLALIEAGYEVVLATPNGERPPLDEASDSADHFGGDVAAYEQALAFWNTDPVMTRPRSLAAVIADGLDSYAGVFFPGGHAPVVDLMQDREAGEILRHFHEASKPTALLCHGPAAVAAALPHAREFRAALIAGDPDKAAEWAKGWQYAGYRMTIFSNSEEKIVEDHLINAKLHFYMVDALTTAGGDLIVGEQDFAPHVIEDRELITGQNPASDHLLAKTFVAALDRSLAA